MLNVRQNCAHKSNDFVRNNSNSWKVFNILFPEQLGMIFDVNPDKTGVRVLSGERRKLGLIRFARIAPGCAKTKHERDLRGFKPLGQRGGIRKVTSHVSAKQNDCL